MSLPCGAVDGSNVSDCGISCFLKIFERILSSYFVVHFFLYNNNLSSRTGGGEGKGRIDPVLDKLPLCRTVAIFNKTKKTATILCLIRP